MLGDRKFCPSHAREYRVVSPFYTGRMDTTLDVVMHVIASAGV